MENLIGNNIHPSMEDVIGFYKGVESITWAYGEVLNLSDFEYLNTMKFKKDSGYWDLKSKNKKGSIALWNDMKGFPKVITKVKIDEVPTHYDNTNGSIYKFCNDQKLNAWEFDIIKRIVRSRKKRMFKEDLEKTKVLIDLYLKEFENE